MLPNLLSAAVVIGALRVKFVVGLCNCAWWFEPNLVVNSKDRFSFNNAQERGNGLEVESST